MTERLAAIDDHILQHRIAAALALLREEYGYSIPEAIDAFQARYDELRAARPRDFTVGPDVYGMNFYS
jgi:hypothetical protein